MFERLSDCLCHHQADKGKRLFRQRLIAACIFLWLATTLQVQSKEKEPVSGANFTVAGKTSHALQKYSGLTWLGEHGFGLFGSLAAKGILGGRPKFSVKAYSFTDCLAGKFKSAEITLKNCFYKKIPLGDLRLSADTPIQLHWFGRKKKKSLLTIPVMVTVSGEVDEKQISKALQSPKIASYLGFLRINLPGLGDQHLQVLEPKIELKDAQIHIKTWLVTAGADRSTGIPLEVTAKPVLQGDRLIVLEDTRVESQDIIEPDKFSIFVADLLNPLVDFGRMDTSTHALRLKEMKIDDGKLRFTAKLLLVPKPALSASPNPIQEGHNSGK